MTTGLSHVSLSELSLLAKSFCNPRDIPPHRLPDLARCRTDVKHTWLLGESTVNTKSLPTTPVLLSDAAIGVSIVDPDTQMFFLLRNPVAPLVYSLPWSAPPGTQQVLYDWYFAGVATRSITNGGWSARKTYPLRNVVWSDGPDTSVPPADQAFLGPVRVLRSSVGVRSGPDGVNQEPVICANGRYYGFFGGGAFVISLTNTNGAQTLTNVPTGGGLQVTLTLAMFNGTLDDSDAYTETFTIPAGQNSCKKPIGQLQNTAATSQNIFPVGYYCLIIREIRVIAGTEALTASPSVLSISLEKDLSETIAGAIAGTAVNFVYSGYTRLWLQPLHPIVSEGPYMLGKTRVTATSLLLTNVTPGITAGGDIYGARIADHFFNTSPSDVIKASGAQRTGYRGFLAKGGYTWMEPDVDALKFQPYLITSPIDANRVVESYGTPVIDWTTLPAYCHAFVVNAPMVSGVTSSTILQWRVDQHNEFISDSMLANNMTSHAPHDALTNATIVLADAPLFMENWVHVDQLWRAIKSAGFNMLKAGGKAALAQGMRELSLAMPGLLL